MQNDDNFENKTEDWLRKLEEVYDPESTNLDSTAQCEHENDDYLPVKESQKFAGYLTILGSYIALFLGGCLYMWGNIRGYVVSHLAYKGGIGSNSQVANFIMPLSLWVSSPFLVVGTCLLRVMDVRLILTVGFSCMVISALLSAQAADSMSLTLSYGVLMAVGIGLS